MTDLFGKELHYWPCFLSRITRKNSLGRQMYGTQNA